MKENKKIYPILLVANLILGGWVVAYYWINDSWEARVALPMPLLIPVFGYILIQILKRYLFARKNWWDWLYYLGLFAVVLPTYFMDTPNQEYFHWITDFGSFFLIVPILMDGKSWINEK